MKTIIINFILFFIIISSVSAAQLTSLEANRIALAIKRAENSTSYPRGVRSINTHGSETKALQICLNSISNNFVRWEHQTNEFDYITFLGKRYSPINSSNDPRGLNRNWVKNVKGILGTNFCAKINSYWHK